MTNESTTQVVIVGAGPSGLLLGQLLQNASIDHVILENKSLDYVLSRIRAGVLEEPTVEAIIEAGAGERLQRESLRMEGFTLSWDEGEVRIPFDLTDKVATVYGQTEVTKDLVAARERSGGTTHYEVANVQLHDFDSRNPTVTYEKNGESFTISCEFIVGCDGFHGVSRQSVKGQGLTEHELRFPFSWLGILADVPPVSEEVLWQNHPDGFAMCSLRSPTRSRYYLQVSNDDKIENWNEERFYEEFAHRMPDALASKLVTGPALEMSIAPLRSFVAEPLRFNRLFLVGDAAHIVPPTGAKGLNLAIADAKLLSLALRDYYHNGDETGFDNYTKTALNRIWKAVRFSWWMTNLMHVFPNEPFKRKLQMAELNYIASSEAARKTIAENFCGLD